MTAALTSHPAGIIKSTLPIGHTKPTMPTVQEPTPPHHIQQEDEGERGRRRSRSVDNKDVDGLDIDDLGDVDADGNHANSSNSDGGPVRKRRRSRKGLDKKFECPEKGCGKSYSRAEHLYRHQLNHNPKQVYKCDFPECTRTFVRLDLCNRHKDRHTAKGSTLSRKDSILSQVSPMGDGRPPFAPSGSTSPEVGRRSTGYGNGHHGPPPYSPRDTMSSTYTPMTNTPPLGYPHGLPANGVDYMHHDPNYIRHYPPHPSPTGPQRPSVQTNMASYGVLSPVSTQHGYHSQPTNTPQSCGAPYAPPQNFPPITLPPPNFNAQAGSTTPREAPRAFGAPNPDDYSEQGRQQGAGEMVLLDHMSVPTTIPVFGSDSILNKSPYVGMPEDFISYMFNTQGGEGSPMAGVPIRGPSLNYGEYSQNQHNVPYYQPEMNAYFPAQPGGVMSVTNLLDANLPESIISEDRSIEIYEFIKERFHENGHAPVDRRRESIFEGDRNDDSHMLSRKMMQAYIGSYWLHFSDQVPILHKPTFSPDKTPNLLLIAMMTIGAACLDKAHGKEVTKAGAQLSNFLAWHLRWEMFQDPSCRPPAKLWAFQALLLLELYEKMYSTRELHERAHIHHATTITLMRRGRALIGKSAMDSPPNPREDRSNSRHSSTSGMVHTPDEWWNHWIMNEATRRVAFAAFIIDSIHAHMFGHSTVMVAHEMRLPLPCDDKLWKATSGAEVGRIEASIMAVGGKPVSFLEGVKKTLGGDEVETNSFGRTVLMAGLLSVSWHMNQRDMQIHTLGNGMSGMSQSLGGRERWRSTVIRAFDRWRDAFDSSLQKADISPNLFDCGPSNRGEANMLFESRIVLHHLAHMAMHVDIVDCQIFARAKRLLGRAIGAQDLASAQRRMKDWAPTAKARDAAFYALKFLASVLLTKGSASQPDIHNGPDEPYSARDDVLLNRPWVLYFAVLVVWCYGYALEGPCPDAALPSTRSDQVHLMREYLLEYSSISAPDALVGLKGINCTTPLMMVLKDSFELSRWELLNEGAALLRNCIILNTGAAAP